MKHAEDFYAAEVAGEVSAVLDFTLQQVSRYRFANDAAIAHLRLASTALRDEAARRQASLCNPRHGALASWQLAKAKVALGDNACEGDATRKAAEACFLSPGHFSRAFKMSTGKSPHQWVIEARLERAKSLLLNSTLSMDEISRVCGYNGRCHFTRLFSRDIGVSPGAWRRMFHTHFQPGVEPASTDASAA
jgi:AraC family transcriptional regulator